MERECFYQNKLRNALSERVARNPRYSLRAFAQLLGMDPGTFSQIISGKRFISEAVARKIFGKLDLSPEEETEFLRSLAEAKAAAGLKRISPEFRKLLKAKGATAFAPKELSIDLFKIIADWYHAAILELPHTQGFKSDPKWIASALGISTAEVHSAVQRLIALELLTSENGKLSRVDAQLNSGDRHLTHAALRQRQKQILEKSIHSLQNDPIEIRNHTAMTFAIDSRKVPEAKKRIEKFVSEMTEFLEAGERDQVYEMTVNLFPLQNHSKRKTITKGRK